MSEELTERLSRFTPDRGGLDRDSMLFAAGRASARPNRRWIALAGMLAASQLLTLVLFWPRPTPPGTVPVAKSTPSTVTPVAPIDPAPRPSDESTASWALWQKYAEGQRELPPLRPIANLRPDAPPLHACLVLSGELPQ